MAEIMAPNSFNGSWLSGYISWTKIMMAIGYLYIDSSLPKRIECKICGGQAIIYPDTHLGEWIHCQDCKISCDVLQYAATFWHLDIKTTAHKLASMGVPIPRWIFHPHVIPAYEGKVLGINIEAKALWNKLSSQTFPEESSYQYLVDHFGMTIKSDPDRWLTQMKPFIGWANDPKVGFAKANPTVKAKEPISMVLIYHDLPGRVSGFRYFFKNKASHFESISPTLTANKEAGLAFYEAAFSFPPQFLNTTFVLQDPVLAVKLHSRWFKDSQYPLPLVLANGEKPKLTRKTFSRLPKRMWVFWSDIPTAEVFSQAAQIDGRVSIYPIEKSNLNHCLAWLLRVRGKSLPWNIALEHEIPKLSDPDVEKIIFNLGFTDLEWDRFVAKCSKENRERFNRLYRPKYPIKTFAFIGYHGKTNIISETQNGWYVDGIQVSDVIVRIDKVVMTREDYDYHLTLIFKGQEHKTIMSFDEVHKYFSTTIEQVLLACNAGLPKFIHTWEKHLYSFAKHFQDDIKYESLYFNPYPVITDG